MKAKKETETLTIRPGLKYRGLIGRLKEMADKDKRSLNNFLLIRLNEIASKSR
jgi:hypothetical protein